MKLLDQIGRGLLDVEDGFALPPSEEGLASCADLLRRAHAHDPDAMSPEDIEECGRDLIAYVLTFQDQGYSIEAAVQCWAEEWMLLDE